MVSLIHTPFFRLIIPSFINLQIFICFDSRMTRYKSQIPAICNGNCQLYLVVKFDAPFLDDKFLVTIHCMFRNHYLFYSYCLVCRKYPVKKNNLQQLAFYSAASWVEVCRNLVWCDHSHRGEEFSWIVSKYASYGK